MFGRAFKKNTKDYILVHKDYHQRRETEYLNAKGRKNWKEIYYHRGNVTACEHILIAFES